MMTKRRAGDISAIKRLGERAEEGMARTPLPRVIGEKRG